MNKKELIFSLLVVVVAVGIFLVKQKPLEQYKPNYQAPPDNNYMQTNPQDMSNVQYPFNLSYQTRTATPADPYQYAEGWKTEIESLTEVNKAYPIFWKDTLYLGLDISDYRQSDEIELVIKELVKERDEGIATIYFLYDKFIEKTKNLYEDRKQGKLPIDHSDWLTEFELKGQMIDVTDSV